MKVDIAIPHDQIKESVRNHIKELEKENKSLQGKLERSKNKVRILQRDLERLEDMDRTTNKMYEDLQNLIQQYCDQVEH